MLSAEIDQKVLQTIHDIAPESADQDLDKDINLQEQLDLDSIDLIHYLELLQKEFHVKIPESETQTLLTINGATRYISEHKPH